VLEDVRRDYQVERIVRKCKALQLLAPDTFVALRVLHLPQIRGCIVRMRFEIAPEQPDDARLVDAQSEKTGFSRKFGKRLATLSGVLGHYYRGLMAVTKRCGAAAAFVTLTDARAFPAEQAPATTHAATPIPEPLAEAQCKSSQHKGPSMKHMRAVFCPVILYSIWEAFYKTEILSSSVLQD
jgi:hypothetical protein